MKKGNKKPNLMLSPIQKKTAKAHSFAAMLTSFKTEGVSFTPEQQKKLRARLQLSK